MLECSVLGPRVRRTSAYPLVGGENLLNRDWVRAESYRVRIVLTVGRQSVRNPLRDFGLDPRLSALELGEGTRRHPAHLGELRLSQTGHDPQITEEPLVFRDRHQFGDRNAQRFGDAGEGVDAGGGIAAFPAIDGAGTDVCDAGQFCGSQADSVPGGDEGGAVESAQDSSAHACLSSLVTPCHFAGTPAVLSQDDAFI